MADKLKLTGAELGELHALPDDPLLKTREAAAFLNLSPATLYWYRAQGMGPEYVRVGANSVRYRVGALRDYIKSLRPGIGRPKQEG